MKVIKRCGIRMEDSMRQMSVDEVTYAGMMEPYITACEKIEDILERWNAERQEKQDHELFHTKTTRIKALDSVLEKMNRKGVENSYENMMNRVTDVAGIRLICYYIGEVEELAELVKTMPGCFVLKEKNYIKEPKENGYRSHHITIAVPVGEKNGRIPYIPVEIQLRTMGMDWWANMEHRLCYKPTEVQSHLMESEMRKYSKRIYQIEMQMSKYAHCDEEENECSILGIS